MARQHDIQYVQFYTAGSVAQKFDFAPEKKTQPRPKTRKQTRKLIYVDPVAILGVVTAVIGLAMTFFGCYRGEAETVLSKAIRICLECIGIG